jgi:hypothetical protein
MTTVVAGAAISNRAPMTAAPCRFEHGHMISLTSRTRRGAGAGLAVVALVALASCRSTSSGAGPATPSTGTDVQQILAIGHQYSQCVRDHGITDFPDLVYQDGYVALPDDDKGTAAGDAIRGNSAVQDACSPILRQLPANAQKNPPLTDQDRQNLLKFAQCIREHGVSEWPDPRPNGSFPIAGTPLQDQLKSTRVADAEKACRQYWDRSFSIK